MHRRTFHKWGLASLGAMAIAACTKRMHKMVDHGEEQTAPERIVPPPLRPGDTVGLIAPASPFKAEDYEKALRNASRLGLKVREGAHLHRKWGYLAGRDDERVADIHAMYADAEVRALWCIRGGYGTTRLLSILDYDFIRKHPKPIIGFSDITALMHAVWLRTGIVQYHGPVAKSTLEGYTGESFRRVVMAERQETVVITYEAHEGKDADIYKPEVISPGDAEGILTGGNLSLLAALCGTDFHWDAAGKLVFIEDVGESPYRVDRMLTQLIDAANLDKAAGIILGVFRGCERKPGEESFTLKQVIRDRLGGLGVPVFYGFTFGHVSKIATFPIGVWASWESAKRQLTIHWNK